MNIQMVDVKRQYVAIKEEIDRAVMSVLESGMFINGPDVKEFSKEIENYLGVKHAIPCASGTDALQLALMALDIQPGDEVITTSFTFYATAEVISLLGATPVFVDIEESSFNIDPRQIESAITSKTKAIIPVHLYGQPVDMDEIMVIAKKYNIPVIEDSAQALGAEYKGKKVCTIGDMGCISFFPSKNLGGYGDGGMVTTNNDDLAGKLRMLANHGSSRRYYHDYIGINSRLDSIQAAILRVKSKYLDEWNRKRFNNAQKYSEQLAPVGLSVPAIKENRTHIFHQYTLKVSGRDDLDQYLTEQKIPHAIYYPVPLHLQNAFREKYGFKEGMLPITEKLSEQVISLPMHPDLTDEEINYICDKIKSFYS
ncbi:MAG: DegT/DnrJ/EryC1/StrS family aminotransferase [Calditrichia bacterium]